MDQKDLNNKANLKNPNNRRYWRSRGYLHRPYNWRDLICEHEYDSDDNYSQINRANQKNPNHISYWKSRGYALRPSHWRDLVESDEYDSDDDENNGPSLSGRSWVVPVQNSSTAVTTSSNNVDHTLGWITGGIIVGVGLLAAVGAVATAMSTEDENKKKEEKNKTHWKFN